MRYNTIVEIEEQGVWASSLSEIGMSDGLEYAKKALRAEPISKNREEIFVQYGSALRIMGQLGPGAQALLPELERLIARVDKSDRWPMIKYNAIKDAVAGKNFAPPIAVNGSGWLDSKHPPVLTGEEQSGKKSGFRSLEANSVPISTVENSPQPSSNTFLWIWLVSALGVAILALLAKLLRARRNNSKAQ